MIERSNIQTAHVNSRSKTMTFVDGLITAARSLKANRPRAILSVLGIVIGIASVISIMSLGEGAQELIVGELQGMGSKVIVVQPGRQPRGISDIAQSIGDSLKEKDLDALKKKSNVPYASKVEALGIGASAVTYGDEKFIASIFGASSILQSLYQVEMAEGRFIDEEDVKGMQDVIVIGSKIRDDLFDPGIEALGSKVKIKERNFKVVGIIKPKGRVSFVNLDETVIMPYTTAQRYVFGIKYFHHILVEADTEEHVDQTIFDVEKTLRESHNIDDPKKDDFSLSTQKSTLDQVKTITDVMTLFIALVAAISLIVGGIGIMNIMLVSVTERTREIGLRKAIGATRWDILEQFLMESVLLTGIGGVLGVFTGALFSWIISFALRQFAGLDWAFNFSFVSVLLGIGVSTAVGIVFGIYPARTAAAKEPIESLRYE